MNISPVELPSLKRHYQESKRKVLVGLGIDPEEYERYQLLFGDARQELVGLIGNEEFVAWTWEAYDEAWDGLMPQEKYEAVEAKISEVRTLNDYMSRRHWSDDPRKYKIEPGDYDAI